MDKTTWEEIKTLASDFKRAQATSTNLKLSERNCIDIINYLCNNKHLSLHFTTDGKTFLTPEELTKEIYEELEVCNGRVSFTNICNSLDLDTYTIENAITNIIQKDNELQIVMNCLINSSYIRQISLKINEIVKDRGKSTLGELTQLFDLPIQFLDKLILNNIGSIIDAHKDGELIYTNAFIRRHSSMIRGYLTRASKPVLLSTINQRHESIPDKLTLRIISDLIDRNRLFGRLDNNKTVFIPEIFVINQKSYLKGFFAQNNYLEFSTMREVGVQYPMKWAQMELPGSHILANCVLGSIIVNQLEAAVLECDRSDGYLNCTECLPSAIDPQDLHELIDRAVKPLQDRLRVIDSEFVVSCRYIERCLSCFDDIIRVRAEECVRNKHQPPKKAPTVSIEDNEESIGGRSHKAVLKVKSGGGQRGREIKSKIVKNKYLVDRKSRKESNSDEFEDGANNRSAVLSESEAVELLVQRLEDSDAPTELLEAIYRLLERQIDQRFREECRSVIVQTSDTAKIRGDHRQLESAVAMAVGKIRLIEKSIVEIGKLAPLLQQELTKHCLRTLCTEVANNLCESVAHDNDIEWDVAGCAVTSEARSKLIGQLKQADLANKMRTMCKSIRDDSPPLSLEGFYASLDDVCVCLDLYQPMKKKVDKKTEKRVATEMAMSYWSALEARVDSGAAVEPGELLLITTLLLWQRLTGWPLHASGKFVPDILAYLHQNHSKGFEDSVDWTALKRYQHYVVAVARMGDGMEEERAALVLANRDIHDTVLALARNWRDIKGA